jgi:hypothetical protein
MKELPIEFVSRLREVTQQIEIDFADDSNFEFISKMVMMNKIVFIADAPTFYHNGKLYECPTFKINSIEDLSKMLEQKYSEGQLFCFYRLFQSLTMYNPSNSNQSHRSMMMRGTFVSRPGNFELKEIIDRDAQIEKILN